VSEKPVIHGNDHRGRRPTGGGEGADPARLWVDSTANVGTDQGVRSYGAAGGQSLLSDGAAGSVWGAVAAAASTEYAVYDSTGVYDVGAGAWGEVFLYTWAAPVASSGAFTYSGANDELAVFSGSTGSAYAVWLNVQFTTPVNAKRFEFSGLTVQGTRGHPGSWSSISDAHAAFTYDSQNHGTYLIGTYKATWQNARVFTGIGPDFASGFGYEEDHTGDPITSDATLLVMRLA
jgi:hypothetical protein